MPRHQILSEFLPLKFEQGTTFGTDLFESLLVVLYDVLLGDHYSFVVLDVAVKVSATVYHKGHGH